MPSLQSGQGEDEGGRGARARGEEEEDEGRKEEPKGMDEPHRLDEITEDDLPVGCSFSMLVAPVGMEDV